MQLYNVWARWATYIQSGFQAKEQPQLTHHISFARTASQLSEQLLQVQSSLKLILVILVKYQNVYIDIQSPISF